MTIGKNKRLTKGKKGLKKKAQDPFARKELYDVKAPSIFAKRLAGRTIVNKTAGTRIASDELRGRVFEVNLADLNGGDEAQAYRKIRLIAEDVQGTNVLTNFHGMDLTRDKLNSLIKKWQTLIEAHVDVRTTDGYTLRIFAIAFTKKVAPDSKDKDSERRLVKSYAQSGKIRSIRKKIFDILIDNASKSDLKELVQKFISSPETMSEEIQKKCESIYPLQNVYIRKVKVLKKPNFDVTKLMELHGTSGVDDSGVVLDKIAAENTVKSLAGAGGRL